MKKFIFSLAVTVALTVNAQQSPPNVEWTKDYWLHSTFSYSLAVEANDNFSFIAKDNSENGTVTHHLVKTNGTAILSDVTLNVPAPQNYYPWMLVATADGGYVTSNENDGTLQKYAANGSLLWNISFGSNFYVDAFIKTNDNNLLVVGGNIDEDDSEFFYLIRKMDNSGNTIWEKKANKFNNVYYEPLSIAQTSDNGYIVGGVYTNNPSNEYADGYSLVKLNASGNVMWEKRFPIPANIEFWPSYLMQTDDGGYIMGAECDDDNGPGNGDFYARYDANGAIIWSAYTGTDKSLQGIVKATDSGYILLIHETADSDHLQLKKINDSGNVLWQHNYENMHYMNDVSRVGNGFVTLGNTYNNTGTSTVKLSKFGSGTAATTEVGSHRLQVTPNPAADFIQLKMENQKSLEKIDIFDASGKKVISHRNSVSDRIEVRSLPKGVYYIQVESGTATYTSSFIKK